MSQRFRVIMPHGENKRYLYFSSWISSQRLLEERRKLENHVTKIKETQMKSIAEFQKAYEVSLRSLNLVRNFHHGCIN